MLDTPCKGCKDRWVNDKQTCHSTCPKYKKWQQEHRRQVIKQKIAKGYYQEN